MFTHIGAETNRKMIGGSGSSIGFAIPEDRVTKSTDFRNVVPDFISQMPNGNVKARLQSQWEKYLEVYNQYGQDIATFNLSKKTAAEVLAAVTDFLRNIYFNSNDSADLDTIMAACQLGWQRIIDTLGGISPETFGKNLTSAMLSWRNIYDGTSELNASSFDYQNMMTCLEACVNDCYVYQTDGKPASENGIEAVNLFKTLVRDLTYCGFTGEFYWIAPAGDINMASKSTDNTEVSAITAAEHNVPDNVPNYRLALDVSPRVCGNCRFFEGKEGAYGNCRVYKFEAKANYLCDAWQAIELTPTHTPVRSSEVPEDMAVESEPEVEAEPAPTAKANITRTDGTPKVIPGRVGGRRNEHVGINDVAVEIETQVGYNDGDTIRAARRSFLPNDRVFSESLQSMAIITGIIRTGAEEPVYAIRLLDGNGVGYGSAVVVSDDLVLRSEKAVKVGEPIIKPQVTQKSEDDIEALKQAELDEMVDIVRSVRKLIMPVLEAHASIETDMKTLLKDKKYISIEREINPLLEEIKTIAAGLKNGVKTGPKRKYYRAVQNAEHSLGAARQMMWSGYKRINEINYSVQEGAANKTALTEERRQVVIDCHKAAYARIKQAVMHLDDSLTMPSHTHGTAAPGIE